MASFGISVENSKFSCLPCDDEAEVKKGKNRGKKKENAAAAGKKEENQTKNKKKNDKRSLQSMAVLPNKNKKQQTTTTTTTTTKRSESSEPDADWQTWHERDVENVDSEFERNLQQALLLSKLEAEQARTLMALAGEPEPTSPPAAAPAATGAVSKKKQKKSQQSSGSSSAKVKTEKTLPLASFLNEPSPPSEGRASDAYGRLKGEEGSSEQETLLISPHFATLAPKPKTYEVEASDVASAEEFVRSEKWKEGRKEDKRLKEEKEKEKSLIDQLQRDVGKIIRKEECTQFLKNNEHLISETVRSAQFLADIEDKDKEIQTYKEQIEKMKEEFAKVKKRNKQLAFIISQGEMQEKADLITEIDELQEVKNELTSQTIQLQQELEQERTKNHKLTKELQSLKGSKGGKQSSPSGSDS